MGAVYQNLEPVDLADCYDKPLPLGPDGLLHGTLDNGLKYYVRQCAKPKARAALALAVKVGSLAEEEHERGIAHILEHLAFNATENYEHHAIVKFLESIGAAFGACQNAYTSCDETVYTLMVRTDDNKLLDTSIAVMAEFAARIRCAPEDLAKERGAVLEELRMGNDSQGRMMTAHWKALMKGCKYADRLPIGLESIIRKVPAAVIADFYKRWYTPEHMAVVVVGDFPDCSKVADMIKQHLGAAFTSPAGSSSSSPQQHVAAVPRPPLPVVSPDSWQHTEPRFCVFSDREAQDSALYISWKVPSRPTCTPAQYVEVLKDELFMICLNQRLYRLSRAREPPFFAATMSDEATCNAVDMYVLSASCEEKKVLRALETLVTEIARVRLYGFSQREFNNAIKNMQADIESIYLEADQGYCTDIRDEYIRHFLRNEFVTGQRYEACLDKTLLPLITLEDMNARAALFTHTNSAVFKSIEHRSWHSESAMRRVVLKVAADESSGAIGPWQEPDMPEPLMKQVPHVPDEWYTACGLQPPSEDDAAAQEAAAAAAVAAAAELVSAGSGTLSSRRMSQQHRHLGGHHPPGLASCSSSGGGSCADHQHHHSQQQQQQQQQQLEPLPPVTPEPLLQEQQQSSGQQEQQQQSGQQQQQQSIYMCIQPGSGGMVHPGVVSQRHYPDLDVTELTLVNGLRVSLKHTDYFADEVVITALAVGGLSEVPRDGFYTASMSGVVSSQLGPFGHKPEVLAEMLAGRRVALSPSEGAYGRHVKGSASPHDLEATFQLLHLLFTQPPKLEPGEMDSVMVQLRQGVEAQQRNPLHAYHSRVRLTNYDCYFFEPITLQELDKVDLDAACAHHSSSFSNPSEFTLVLTGNTSLEALLPLVTRYLATIPAAAGRGGRMDPRQVTPLPFRFPEHPVVEDVEVDMVSPLTQCQITLPVHLDRPVAREQLWWLNSACKLLETRLLQKLRFEMGDLYTVSVGSFFGCDAPSSTAPQLKGDVSIAFTCDPANKGRLVSMALDTLQCLQEDGPTPDEIDTLRRIETFEWENMLGENSFWHDVTVNGYQSRRFAETNDLDVVWGSIRDSRDKMMESMSCERLREVLCQLFPYPCKSRYTAITMMPRPPGLLGSMVFKWVTASTTTKAAVLAAGLAVVAAGVAAAVAARRRAAR